MYKLLFSRKVWYLLLYYGIARYFPPSNFFFIGRIGGSLRRFCAQHLFKHCGKHVNIEYMAYFGSGKDIEIGDRSGIGIHCRVPNDIKIGENVMMGPHCYILGTDTHCYSSVDIPMIDQGRFDSKKPTIIGDDVWIGRESMMIGGKTIGSHTIIGARSVICRNVPDYVVAAGNPIRIVRKRV